MRKSAGLGTQYKTIQDVISEVRKDAKDLLSHARITSALHGVELVQSHVYHLYEEVIEYLDGLEKEFKNGIK